MLQYYRTSVINFPVNFLHISRHMVLFMLSAVTLHCATFLLPYETEIHLLITTLLSLLTLQQWLKK